MVICLKGNQSEGRAGVIQCALTVNRDCKTEVHTDGVHSDEIVIVKDKGRNFALTIGDNDVMTVMGVVVDVGYCDDGDLHLPNLGQHITEVGHVVLLEVKVLQPLDVVLSTQ